MHSCWLRGEGRGAGKEGAFAVENIRAGFRACIHLTPLNIFIVVFLTAKHGSSWANRRFAGFATNIAYSRVFLLYLWVAYLLPISSHFSFPTSVFPSSYPEALLRSGASSGHPDPQYYFLPFLSTIPLNLQPIPI